MKGHRRRSCSLSRCSPRVPLITSSNVVLNFLVMALLIALVGQGWNMLGGYGGQYSFGHAAFFGTGAYVTAILQMRYGVNAWVGFVLGIAAGALVGAVIGALSFRSGLQGLVLRAGDAGLRRSVAHRRQRRADHRRRRRHADQARPAARGVPVPEPRAVLLDRARAGRRVARSSCALIERQPLRRLSGGRARERGRGAGARRRYDCASSSAP